MDIALSASVRGLNAASARLDSAATTIAQSGGPPPPRPAADPAPTPPSGNAALTSLQEESGEDVQAALVDTLQARRAYEANAKALEANAQVAREATELGA